MCMPFLLGLDPCNLTVPTGWLTTELFVQNPLPVQRLKHREYTVIGYELQ